jgi:hypothetical protein
MNPSKRQLAIADAGTAASDLAMMGQIGLAVRVEPADQPTLEAVGHVS